MSFVQDLYAQSVVYRSDNVGNGTTVTSLASAERTIVWPAATSGVGQVLRASDTAGTLGWADVVANGDTMVAAVGSVGTPGFTFTGDTDTGIYQSGANIMNFGTGGVIALTIDASQDVTVAQDLTVTGNLTVSGTTTTINTETLTVEDPLIFLGKGNLTTDAKDIGLYGLYDTTSSLNLYAGMYRDATDNKFKFYVDSQVAPDLNVVNPAATGYTNATVLVGGLDVQTVDDAVTIVSATLGAPRTYTLPDAGEAAEFIMSKGVASFEGQQLESETITDLSPTLTSSNKRVIYLDAATAVVTVTLPAKSVPLDGLLYTFIARNVTNTVTIKSVAETIDGVSGATGLVLTVVNQRCTLMLDNTGSNWLIV